MRRCGTARSPSHEIQIGRGCALVHLGSLRAEKIHANASVTRTLVIALIGCVMCIMCADLPVFHVVLIRVNCGAVSCIASVLLLGTRCGRSMSCTWDGASTSGMILRILSKIRYLLDTLGACFRVLT